MDDKRLVEIGARNRYEQIRAMPGMRDHWPSWDEARREIRATYRTVFSAWLEAVRSAEAELDGFE